MASLSLAQEASRGVRARIEASNQQADQTTLTETSEFSSSITSATTESSYERGFDEESKRECGDEITRRYSDSQLEYLQGSTTTEQRKRQDSPPLKAIHYSTLNLNILDGVDSSDQPLSQEDFLKAIYDRVPSGKRLLSLMEQLLEVQKLMADRARHLEETKLEFVWSSVLQLVGLLFVVIFGVFGALALNAADIANKQSAEANQMAILTFCMLNPVSVNFQVYSKIS
jgi:hypothetical protein